MPSGVASEMEPLQIAIIGSGPSAFYAADDLLKNEAFPVQVHLFEKLPTPYGLVRGGVAPDHVAIKSVTKIYERIAQKPGFYFWGNVSFGETVSHEDLKGWFDAVIYATGASSDRHLGIPGESLPGSVSATDFVGWYNGHPDYQHLSFDLSHPTAVIVGMGNVALDVARILVRPIEDLEKTDITDAALDTLRQSKIRDVFLVGRRGPVQAACTPVELREFGHLEGVDALIDPQELELVPMSQEALEDHPSRNLVQNMELFSQFSQNQAHPENRHVHFWFRRSPVEILGKQQVSEMVLATNRLEEANGKVKALPTEETISLPTGLVFRSVGYHGVPLPGVPFDASRGIIPNIEGRVIDPANQQPIPQEYVVGWAKRGPSGVIGTNKHDAIETTKHLLHDLAQQPRKPIVSIAEKLKGIPYVTFADWKKLDAYEIQQGNLRGKPRHKVISVPDMLNIIQSQEPS